MKSIETHLGQAEELERSHRGKMFQFYKTPPIWLDGTVVVIDIFPEGISGRMEVLTFSHGFVYGVEGTDGPMEGYMCMSYGDVDSLYKGVPVGSRFLYGHLVDAVNEELDVRGVPHIPLGWAVEVLWDVGSDASEE